MDKFKFWPNAIIRIERGSRDKKEVTKRGDIYKSYIDGVYYPDIVSISIEFAKEGKHIKTRDIKKIQKLLKEFIKNVESLDL